MEEKQGGKRERIINAAIEVLSKGNYETMRTASVAAKAGIAEGTIYRYFAGKRELFIEVLREIGKRLEKYFLQGVVEANTLKTNILLLAELFYQRNPEINGLYRILYKAFSEVEDAEIREELAETYEVGFEVVNKIISWEVNRRKIPYRKSQIEIAFMMLWGVGDMMWKREMVGSLPAIGQTELEGMLDIFMKLLDG